jgi:hypothetical protein
MKDFLLIRAKKKKKDMATEKALATISFPDPSMPVNAQSILSSSVRLLLHF